MLTSTGLVSSMTPSVQVWWQCRTTRWLQRNLFTHVNQVSCSHAVQLGQDRTEMLLNGQHDRLLPKASSKILPEPTDLVQPLFLTGPQLMRARSASWRARSACNRSLSAWRRLRSPFNSPRSSAIILACVRMCV